MTNKRLNAIKTTLFYRGGLTLNCDLSGATFNGGYVVSLNGFEYVTKVSKLNKRLLNLYSNIAQRLGGFVGLWIDNNKLYLDISIHIKDKQQALYKGLKEKQKAIYSVSDNETIYIK